MSPEFARRIEMAEFISVVIVGSPGRMSRELNLQKFELEYIYLNQKVLL